MKLVDTKSLAQTLCRIDDALMFNGDITKTDRTAAAKWIAGRQGLPGSYAGMFAPTEYDYHNGIRIFTGEHLKTRAGIGHILGEEACRALIKLDVKLKVVDDALAAATKGMTQRLRKEKDDHDIPQGFYCCGKCSVAYWRHLAAGGFNNQNKVLARAMKILKAHRDGQGKWRRFPFYYTLLALSEIGSKPAVAELKYAQAGIERALNAMSKYSAIAKRRQAIAKCALEMSR